jgi:glycosyltransferase involved in cell wall biosynthesis
MLPTCIESIARHGGVGTDYVVVDGASTDGTQEVIRGFGERVTRWVSEPDTGTYDAMNKGVRLATGDWVLFLGADDELVADLSEVAPQLVDPATIYYGDVLLKTRGERYDGPFDAAKLARRNICHQAILYPRSVFQKYAFDTRYRLQADWELNMRCFSDPAFRFQYLPVVVAHYDNRGLSARHRDLALEADYPRLLWRHFPARVALPLMALALGGRALRAVGFRHGAA